MIDGLIMTAKMRGARAATLTGYGPSVSIERMVFDRGRESLAIDYAVVGDLDLDSREDMEKLEKVYNVEGRGNLRRSLEMALPSSEGWDIH